MVKLNLHLHLFTLSVILVHVGLFFRAESTTQWEDIRVLRRFKDGLDPGSITPGSCLSSWNFSFDPCDNAFGQHFTCGLRCDSVVSGLSRVTELSLDQAGYSGPLSSLSWNLPYLETLDLAENFFSGSLPNSFTNLTRLRRLSLSRNSFSGEIPPSIGSLSTLEELYIDNNNLNGSIPASFNGLWSLKRLEIQSNNLSGEFPYLGWLKNLYFLDASNNLISGDVPTNFPVNLIEISMRNNLLKGPVPESIRNLGFLQVLDLSHNKLSGQVSQALFDHPSLQQLTLSNNKFDSIQIPRNSGTKSELIAIDLSNNELRGLLPTFMASMPKLSALSLENNKLTGMIPTQFALKAVLPGSGISTLERLLLGGNYLFGPIPRLLLGLKPEIATVRLGDNCLYRCPSSFFFCQGRVQKSLMECKSFGSIIP